MPLTLFAPLGMAIALAGAGLFWKTNRRRLAISLTALGVIMVVVVVVAAVSMAARPT